MEIPYHLIPLIASVGLGLAYVFTPRASWRSKAVVAAMVAASLVIWWGYPRWFLVATLLQVAASIYVLFYLKATTA